MNDTKSSDLRLHISVVGEMEEASHEFAPELRIA
jgi:hypothetical protein